MPDGTSDLLLGVNLVNADLSQLVKESLRAIQQRSPAVVFACANPHSLVISLKDSVFRNALNSADMVVADGAGIRLGAVLAGVEAGPRITGSDFFAGVMKELNSQGYGRVFFFGSTERVLDLIATRVKREYASLEVCGMISPPFRPWSEEENSKMIAAINEAKPDVLWVGMTAPKQEKWVARSRRELVVPVVASVGAVFDFFAGTHPRAPGWMCTVGIEWLYRLVREPKRMWRRNFVSTPKFLALVLWNRVFGSGQSVG